MTGTPDFWDALGLRIERADREAALLAMDVPDTLMSPFGQVIGGAVAALFDVALAIALARRLDAADRIATHNLNVTYVAFTASRRLCCRAVVVSLRSRVGIAEGDVVDEEGMLVAKAVGTFGIRRAAT